MPGSSPDMTPPEGECAIYNFKQPGGQASALREITRLPAAVRLSASKVIEEGEAPKSAGAETAAPGGRLAVGPVPSTEGTAGP